MLAIRMHYFLRSTPLLDLNPCSEIFFPYLTLSHTLKLPQINFLFEKTKIHIIQIHHCTNMMYPKKICLAPPNASYSHTTLHARDIPQTSITNASYIPTMEKQIEFHLC